MLAPTAAALAAAPAGEPRDVRGIGTDAQGERVTVSWSPPVDDGGAFVTAYQVQASRDGVRWSASRISECEPPAPDQPCFPELSVVFSYELTVYETYVFRAAAYNSAGWGAWSVTSAPFTVLPGNRPRIQPPRDVVAVPVLKGIEVDWQGPVDPTDASYLLEWSRDGRRWQGAESTRATAFSFAGLSYGDYLVRVRSQRYDVEYSTWTIVGPVTVPDRRQRIRGFTGLPATLALPGKTVLVPCDLTTTADQRVHVAVRWELRGVSGRGSLDPVVVRKRPCGKVTITLGGVPVKVWVALAAPAKGRYAELLRTRTYRIG